MGKILLLVVIALVAFVIVKRYQQSLKAPRAPAKAAEDMVKCAHCDVNLPRGEAITTEGEFFCTAEHQQLGKK